MAEKELNPAAPGSAKPITVTVAVQGGAVQNNISLPIGSTVEDALKAAEHGDLVTRVRAGADASIRVRGKGVKLDDQLQDGDTIVVIKQVQGGN